jgi:SAM-dependent methyltransferase
MTTARYDAVADFYARGWTDDADDPATTALLTLLGPVSGQRVLDVACGHGRISRLLARRGASVVGVDLSGALLERAARALRSEPLDITYVHADASTVDIAGLGGPFSAAVCAFGLSDVDDLDGCLATVARVLSPGDRFVFAILHPCFAGDGEASGSWPPDGSFADERWWAADGAASTLRRQVGANHRMLSTYLNTLRTYGLVLDRVEEPGPTAAWREHHPEAARMPLYLVVRCVVTQLPD